MFPLADGGIKSVGENISVIKNIVKLVYNDHGYNEFVFITNEFHFVTCNSFTTITFTVITTILTWFRKLRYNRV